MDLGNKTRTLLSTPLIQNSEKKKWGQNLEAVGELKVQMRLAGPLVMFSFLQYSFQIISVLFVGHLSLSGASMVTSFAGVTAVNGKCIGNILWTSLRSKTIPYARQTHAESNACLVLISIPIEVLWIYTEHIFVVIGQDKDISSQAGLYSRWLIPSIVPYGLMQCQFRFLQAQNNVSPLMISTGITSLVHVSACWSLVFRFGLGCKGAALANSISYWVNVLILALYIRLSSACKKTWTGFSKEGTENLFGFLSLGVPSALMVCLEFWSYEFLVLMSGFLPNPKLETSMMSISLNLISVFFRIPFGFASAVSTRVSNELGARKPQAARLAVHVAIFLAASEGLLVNLSAVAVKGVWGYLYTRDEDVVTYLSSVMPILAVSNFMDGMQAVVSGTARGCGWQKIDTLVNLGACYLVGLPCAVLLTFFLGFGGKGLWMGIICGSGLQALLLLSITLCINWERQSPDDRTPTILQLIRANRDVIRVKGRMGMTALHWVAQSGDINLLAEFLKACPESIEDLTDKFEAALHVAVKNKKMDAVKVIVDWLRYGWILNLKDHEANTALHAAVLSAEPQTLKALLHSQWTVEPVSQTLLYPQSHKNAWNLEGKTALDVLNEQQGQMNPQIAGETRKMLRIAGATTGDPSLGESSRLANRLKL
ncbi:Multi antimicrobial extrusion protein [Dillenia turbinata]|uniref:Protein DETOXIFICATION n=1 Tax=Dillenia turbinata TaxID=194707 RepID=A0AAN8UXF4_9MAGN